MNDNDKQRPEGMEEPFYYKNGQSEAEKLMSKHLTTPGHEITDEELKNLKVGVHTSPAEESYERKLEEKSEETHEGHLDVPITPWDVLDE